MILRRAFPVLVVALALAGCRPPPRGASAAGDEIPIGLYGSLTGATATFGQSTEAGVTLATDEVNAAGGLLGKKVRLIVEDNQGKPNEAVNAVLKLIQRDRVVAVLGDVASSLSIAAAPVCQQNRVPMISPSSTNPKVTEMGNFIFRACFIDPFQGEVMAKFALDTLKAKTAAVFTDRKNDYSVGLAKFFKEKFVARGGQLVADEGYQAGDREFKPQLTNIRAANPEVVFVPGYYTECALIARQARELGIQVPLLGGDGWDSEVTLQSGGEAVEGVYFSNHYHQDDPRPEVQSFVKKFRELHQGHSPDAMAVTGYDAANILYDAIRRAGSSDPVAIREALAKTMDFKGVSGNITLGPDRNARKSAVVLKIEDGRFKFVQLVVP
ncbi:MAG: ABC transporter substrate-binding protein [Verrucomicrobiae bacterium]|nr:ABC transporter substrate-binding protein [Verrucomicrobiae bacterium]